MKTFLKRVIPLCAVVLLLCACAAPETGSEVENLILIIGDGMGIEHISAGELASGTDYCFTQWQHASVNTDSIDTDGKGPYLTDSAAAGTALATGTLTVNKYVGVDRTGEPLTTILDYAAGLGKSTGIVTTDKLYGATPASFSAHSISRDSSAVLVESQIESGVDLLCGTRDGECTYRKVAIENKGYTYCDDVSQLPGAMSADKTYWQLDLAGAEATVELKDVTIQALNFLDKDAEGFVLVVEQAHIDKYAEKNDFASMEHCVNSLNDTVSAVLEWLGDREDTAILITADHETGGLRVSSQPWYENSYTSSTGQTVYYDWETGTHTRAEVGLFVYGYEADFTRYDYYSSAHLIKNTDVFELMQHILGG